MGFHSSLYTNLVRMVNLRLATDLSRRCYHATLPLARNRILFEPQELTKGADGETVSHLSFDDSRALHIRSVLRSEVGDLLRVGVLDGDIGTASITVLHQKRKTANEHSAVTLVWDKAFESRLPPPPVDLLLALPRPRVMKRLWAPLAAAGVGTIHICGAEKVEFSYWDSSQALNPETMRREFLRGLEQAGDTMLPRVVLHKSRRVFKALKIIEDFEQEEDVNNRWGPWTKLIAHPGSGTLTQRWSDLRREREKGTLCERVLIAIGPEGGWTEQELLAFKSASFEQVSMGPRTLTTESAAVVLVALATEAMTL